MFELRNVTAGYGETMVLRNVSLCVPPQSVVALLGPNGAGKTTLFNAISGTVRTQRGAVRFDGRDLSRLPAYARARHGIGRTFQIPQPMHALTVTDNLTVAQRFGAGQVDPKALGELLALVGLADKAFADAATELSLTELKSLEVAKALATRPRLLLLDEVLAGLEAHGKRAFARMLAEIHQRLQLAIVVIEHDIETINTLCPRVAVLDFGRLIADGTPDSVFANPAVIASYTGVVADA
jgi:branched-chain amino acid transport system ATP-binding protein